MADRESPCKNWSAVHDFMPPRSGRLVVKGECTFPTPGYTVKLSKKEPPGYNPNILILERTVTSPTGVPEPDLLTTIEAHYEEVTQSHYEQVQILPDQTTIPVKEIH